jgi:hypothetical protein
VSSPRYSRTREVWDKFLGTAPESRAKALLTEGELSIPAMDAATIKRTLFEAGTTGNAVSAVTANGADAALVDAAIAAVRAQGQRTLTC